MRKAFKFVSDQGKREGSGRGLEGLEKVVAKLEATAACREQ